DGPVPRAYQACRAGFAGRGNPRARAAKRSSSRPIPTRDVSRVGFEARAEHVLPHLARRIPWQLGDEIELLGDLLHHHAARAHELADLGQGEAAGAGPYADAGAYPLAAVTVGHADDGDLGHLRMRGEIVLDALGREVLALADDDVLPAPRDADEALGVDDAEIAGADEAVRREGDVQRRIEVADAD